MILHKYQLFANAQVPACLLSAHLPAYEFASMHAYYTVACKETHHLGIFPTRDFELSKSCSNLTLLAPNKGGLEVSKKVQYVSVAQWAAKLQHVKLGVIFHKV